MADPRHVVAGRKPIRELLERSPDRIEKVMLQQGLQEGDIAEIRSLADTADVPWQYVPKGRLDVESHGATHQGVVAQTTAIAYRELDDLLREVAPTWDHVQETKPVLLVLDRITDPRNYGAIVRSAVAAGIAGVIVPDSHMAPLTAVAVKASAGSADRIPIARVSNLPQSLIQLKERGYWVTGTDQDAETSLWDAKLARPMALVIGSEGEGMRPDIRSACDVVISIPIRGPIDSLNASVAASLVMYEAMRQRDVAARSKA